LGSSILNREFPEFCRRFFALEVKGKSSVAAKICAVLMPLKENINFVATDDSPTSILRCDTTGYILLNYLCFVEIGILLVQNVITVNNLSW
jgi:hypothetical protein